MGEISASLDIDWDCSNRVWADDRNSGCTHRRGCYRGSGKSSLLKAGVLPRLRRERGWLLLRTFRPGVDPLFNLAEAIAQPAILKHARVQHAAWRLGALRWACRK